MFSFFVVLGFRLNSRMYGHINRTKVLTPHPCLFLSFILGPVVHKWPKGGQHKHIHADLSGEQDLQLFVGEENGGREAKKIRTIFMGQNRHRQSVSRDMRPKPSKLFCLSVGIKRIKYSLRAHVEKYFCG